MLVVAPCDGTDLREEKEKAMSTFTGKPGRPPIPGKRQEVKFRLYGEELALCERAAKSSKALSLTAWAKEVVVAAAKKAAEARAIK